MLFDTKEEALDFLNYHKPNDSQMASHAHVNQVFQDCLSNVWDSIPSGPGKVIFIRALNDARMKANSAIANNGK